jgi:lysophospholipase L1-like esterase
MKKRLLRNIFLLTLGVSLASCSAGGETSSSSDDGSYKYGEKEMYEKLWDSKTIHNETLCLIEQDDGSISGSLIFVADKVISVRDYTLSKEYVEGKDYTVQGKKIIRTTDSKIPYFTKANMAGNDLDPDSGISTYNASSSGDKKIMFTEGVGIVMHQIAVTYTHSDKWEHETPSYFGNSLPTTESKLKNGESLSIVFFGDSIMTGCNSSGKLGIEPFQDLYPDAVTNLLKEKYPNSEITMQNTSYGGWLSADGITNIDNCVNQYHPDLVFLGFGMNDGSWKVSNDDYIDHMDTLIKSVRARTPGAEVIVVSTILANPDSIQNSGQEGYLAPLKEEVASFDSGVALLDMTTYSKNILRYKQSVDIYANNINHPSDFMCRQYVTNIMTSLVEDF